jgi:hypothetical protein
LVLSTEKTNIRRSDTVLNQAEEERRFLERYFGSARDSMARIRNFWNSYSDTSEDALVPEEEEAVIKDALFRILNEWVEGAQPERPLYAKYLSPGSSGVGRAVHVLSDAQLLWHPLGMSFSRTQWQNFGWLSMSATEADL